MTIPFNRVKYLCTTPPGSGPFHVDASVPGFRTPGGAGIADGTPVSYTAQTLDLTRWETGHGVYHASSATISRDTPFEGSSALPVVFAAPVLVWIDLLAQDIATAFAPGGSAGQLQYNSGGTALGGVTVTGDGTISTPTGQMTVLKTSGIPFAPSATTDTTNAANITSGNLSVNRLNGGAGASGTTFWRGDGTWAPSTVTPGGSNGQVQFNSAGALGGFTVGGDGTLNTSTGVLTVTKSGGVSFAPSATIDTTNAANITSGNLSISRLNGGVSASNTTFWRGDGTWATPVVTVPGGPTNSIQYNGGGSFSGVGPLTNGQLLIGSTGGPPVATSLSAGPNIIITPGPGSITIASTGGGGGGGTGASGLGWVDVYSFANPTDQASIIAGTGNNVTYAVTAAIAALPAVGGVLYFRPGRFVTTGGFTISKICSILAFGSSAYVENITPPTTEWITQIETTVGNTPLFTVTSDHCYISGLAMVCTSATPALGGTAVYVNGTQWYQRVDFNNLLVDGFYDNIDIAVGEQWSYNAVQSIRAVRYSLRIRNTINADAGDWSVSNSNFAASNGATANISFESSGGARISNCKMYSDAGFVQHGILVNISGTTSQLLITQVNIEGCNGEPILITNGFPVVMIMNSYMRSQGALKSAIKATNCQNAVIMNNYFLGPGGAVSAITLTNCAGTVVSNNQYDLFATELNDTSGNTYAGISVDGVVFNSIAQVNGNAAQKWSVFNKMTDWSNFERFSVDWQATANVVQIGPNAAGTGVRRPMRFTSPVGLPNYATGSLPSAATEGAGALAYDTTTGAPKYSNGSTWNAITGGGGGTPGGSSGQFQYNNSSAFGGANVWFESADIVAQRDGTTAQKWNVYNTFTSSTVYERFTVDWSAVSNVVNIGTEKGSGGGAVRDMRFITGGVEGFRLDSNGFLTTSGFANYGFTGSPMAAPSRMQVIDNNNNYSLTLIGYSGASGGPGLIMYNTRGAGPSLNGANAPGDYCLYIQATGNDGAQPQNLGGIFMQPSTTFTAGSCPSKLIFATRPASGSFLNSFVFDENQRMSVWANNQLQGNTAVGGFNSRAQFIEHSSQWCLSLMKIATADSFPATLAFSKNRSSLPGTVSSAVQSGDNLGQLLAYGSDTVQYSQAASITMTADATFSSGSAAGRISLATSPSGSATPSEAQRIDNAGQIYFPRMTTTTGTANAIITTGSTPANQLRITSSSARYKTAITEVPWSRVEAAATLDPIEFESTCIGDDRTLRHIGLLAETVAEADPVLVHRDGLGRPDGVMYDRVLLLQVAHLKRRVDELEAKCARLH